MLGYLVFFAVALLSLSVGIWAGTKVKDSDDYFVGGRKLGRYVTLATYAATYLGGAMTLGWISTGYSYGFAGFWYTAPQCIGPFVAAYLLVKPFRSGKFTSLPDFFESIYGDKTVNLLMTIVALITPITWVAGQFAAAGRIMEGLLGLEFFYGVLIMGIIVVAYSVFGGYMSVAYTDAVQFILLVVLFLLVAPRPIFDAGGIGTIVSKLPTDMTKFFSVKGLANITVYIWMFNGLIDFLGIQSTYQRIYSADSGNTAKFGIKWTGILTLLWGILTPLIGMAIFTMNPDLQADQALPWFVANKVPEILGYAFLASIAMATMSTADSMLNSVALNFGHDIYKNIINPKAKENQIMLVGRIATVIFGVISLLWALKGGSIIAFFGYAVSVSSGPLVASVLFTVLATKRRTAKGLKYGIISGVIAGVIAILTPTFRDIVSGGVLFSFFTTIIVAWIIGATTKGNGDPNISNDGNEKDNNIENPTFMSVMNMVMQAFAPFNFNRQ